MRLYQSDLIHRIMLHRDANDIPLRVISAAASPSFLVSAIAEHGRFGKNDGLVKISVDIHNNVIFVLRQQSAGRFANTYDYSYRYEYVAVILCDLPEGP